MKQQKETIEEQILDAAIRYQKLFETSKDGILIFDVSTGKIIDANPFISNILGYDANYFIGKELWEIGLFKNKEENQTVFLNLQKDGYVRFSDMPLITSKKQNIAVEFVCNTYDYNGRKFAQCNIRDITQYRKQDEQIKTKVEILSSASRRKNEFLSLLGHELRNPIAPLSGALHILQLPNLPEETRQEMYGIMERQISTLVHILDNLLDIAHITSRRIELHIEKAELQKMIDAAIQNSKPLIESKGHKLMVSIPPEPIIMEVDSNRVIQVITNLLDNAAKFTPKNGLITLTAQPKDKDIVIKIKDNGIGIDADMIPYIFDMFTKVDNSLTRAEEGLGLGLTLAKDIVELHSGEITVFSKGLGYGSEFTVWLPLVRKV